MCCVVWRGVELKLTRLAACAWLRVLRTMYSCHVIQTIHLCLHFGVFGSSTHFFSHSINRHSRFHSVELMANGWFRSAHVHFIYYTLCRHLECSIPSIRSLCTYILYFSVDAMACLSFQNHLSNQQHSSKCANKLPFLPIVIVTK